MLPQQGVFSLGSPLWLSFHTLLVSSTCYYFESRLIITSQLFLSTMFSISSPAVLLTGAGHLIFIIALKSSLVRGPAANRFQSSAMGKFFSSVPAQIAGSWLTGACPNMMLNSMVAARLMVGHITRTVHPDTISVIKNGLSVSGQMILPAIRCPSLFPHRFEKMKTSTHI